MICLAKVESADIIDDDHGGVALELSLSVNGGRQSFMLSRFNQEDIRKILSLFDAPSLTRLKGRVIYALYTEKYGYIQGLRALPFTDTNCKEFIRT